LRNYRGVFKEAGDRQLLNEDSAQWSQSVEIRSLAHSLGMLQAMGYICHLE